MKAFLLAALFSLFLAGCSTHLVSMKYQPTGQVVGGATDQAAVAVGSFKDERGEEPNYLGAVRGGYYNPFKTIRTDKPVSELVQTQFTEALRLRNLLGTKDSPVIIEGVITKFDCNYYMQRTSNVNLRVSVFTLPSRALLFSNVYSTENREWGWASALIPQGPVFADTESLGQFAEKTLNETIDKALSDPGFIQAVRNARVTSSP